MTRFYHISSLKRLISILIVTALVVPFWLRERNRTRAEKLPPRAVISVVALLVEQDLWEGDFSRDTQTIWEGDWSKRDKKDKSIQDKIKRYALDIQQTLPLTKTTIIPVATSEKTEAIATMLNRLYHGDWTGTNLTDCEDQEERCELVGISLIGEVPIPEVYADLKGSGEAGSPIKSDFSKYAPLECGNGLCECYSPSVISFNTRPQAPAWERTCSESPCFQNQKLLPSVSNHLVRNTFISEASLPELQPNTQPLSTIQTDPIPTPNIQTQNFLIQHALAAQESIDDLAFGPPAPQGILFPLDEDLLFNIPLVVMPDNEISVGLDDKLNDEKITLPAEISTEKLLINNRYLDSIPVGNTSQSAITIPFPITNNKTSVDLSQAGTIEMVVQGVPRAGQYLLDTRSDNNSGLAIFIGADGQLNFTMSSSREKTSTIAAPLFNYDFQDPNHIAVTWQEKTKTESILSLYLDGQKLATKEISRTTIPFSHLQLVIGGHYSPSADNIFTGTIYDLAWHTRAFTDGNIGLEIIADRGSDIFQAWKSIAIINEEIVPQEIEISPDSGKFITINQGDGDNIFSLNHGTLLGPTGDPATVEDLVAFIGDKKTEISQLWNGTYARLDSNISTTDTTLTVKDIINGGAIPEAGFLWLGNPSGYLPREKVYYSNYDLKTHSFAIISRNLAKARESFNWDENTIVEITGAVQLASTPTQNNTYIQYRFSGDVIDRARSVGDIWDTDILREEFSGRRGGSNRSYGSNSGNFNSHSSSDYEINNGNNPNTSTDNNLNSLDTNDQNSRSGSNSNSNLDTTKNNLDVNNSDLDSDSDGVSDWRDNYPNDPSRNYTWKTNLKDSSDLNHYEINNGNNPNTSTDNNLNSLDTNDQNSRSGSNSNSNLDTTKNNLDVNNSDLDSDSDGVSDWRDNYPNDPSRNYTWKTNLKDSSDLNHYDENNGSDPNDNSNPDNTSGNSDNFGSETNSDIDSDIDGVPDNQDNFPYDPNKQFGSDNNDNDRDRDDVNNDNDNCPNKYNPSQKDSDHDGQGDFCDPDFDNGNDINSKSDNDQGSNNSDPNADDDSDGFSENEGDCDDNDKNINPSVKEICDDSIDQDCNGQDLSCDNNNNSENEDGNKNKDKDNKDSGNDNLNNLPTADEPCDEKPIDNVTGAFADGIDNDNDGEIDEGIVSDPEPYLSVFPYTDFRNRAFIWNPSYERWEENPVAIDRQAEIWHGLIRPPVSWDTDENKQDYLRLLHLYFDDNHEYHQSGTIHGEEFEREFLHIDPVHEGQALSESRMGDYQTYLDYMGDIAHYRFGKHLLAKLSEGVKKKISKLQEAFNDSESSSEPEIILPESSPPPAELSIKNPLLDILENYPKTKNTTDKEVSANSTDILASMQGMTDKMRDVETMSTIYGMLTKYNDIIATNYQGDIDKMIKSAGRWLTSEIDTTTKLIATRDNFTRLFLKRANNIIFQTTAKYAHGELPENIFTITNGKKIAAPVAADLYWDKNNSQNGILPPETAEDCTLIRGTKSFSEADSGEIRTLVEANRIYDPSTGIDAAWIGDCFDNQMKDDGQLDFPNCKASRLRQICVNVTNNEKCRGQVGECKSREVHWGGAEGGDRTEYYCDISSSIEQDLDNEIWKNHSPERYGYCSAATVTEEASKNLGFSHYSQMGANPICDPDQASYPIFDITGTYEFTTKQESLAWPNNKHDFLSCTAETNLSGETFTERSDSNETTFPENYESLEKYLPGGDKSKWSTIETLFQHDEPHPSTLSQQTSAQTPPVALPIDNPYSISWQDQSGARNWQANVTISGGQASGGEGQTAPKVQTVFFQPQQLLGNLTQIFNVDFFDPEKIQKLWQDQKTNNNQSIDWQNFLSQRKITNSSPPRITDQVDAVTWQINNAAFIANWDSYLRFLWEKARLKVEKNIAEIPLKPFYGSVGNNDSNSSSWGFDFIEKNVLMANAAEWEDPLTNISLHWKSDWRTNTMSGISPQVKNTCGTCIFNTKYNFPNDCENYSEKEQTPPENPLAQLDSYLTENKPEYLTPPGNLETSSIKYGWWFSGVSSQSDSEGTSTTGSDSGTGSNNNTTPPSSNSAELYLLQYNSDKKDDFDISPSKEVKFYPPSIKWSGWSEGWSTGRKDPPQSTFVCQGSCTDNIANVTFPSEIINDKELIYPQVTINPDAKLGVDDTFQCNFSCTYDNVTAETEKTFRIINLSGSLSQPIRFLAKELIPLLNKNLTYHFGGKLASVLEYPIKTLNSSVNWRAEKQLLSSDFNQSNTTIFTNFISSLTSSHRAQAADNEEGGEEGREDPPQRCTADCENSCDDIPACSPDIGPDGNFPTVNSMWGNDQYQCSANSQNDSFTITTTNYYGNPLRRHTVGASNKAGNGNKISAENEAFWIYNENPDEDPARFSLKQFRCFQLTNAHCEIDKYRECSNFVNDSTDRCYARSRNNKGICTRWGTPKLLKTPQHRLLLPPSSARVCINQIALSPTLKIEKSSFNENSITVFPVRFGYQNIDGDEAEIILTVQIGYPTVHNSQSQEEIINFLNRYEAASDAEKKEIEKEVDFPQINWSPRYQLDQRVPKGKSYHVTHSNAKIPDSFYPFAVYRYSAYYDFDPNPKKSLTSKEGEAQFATYTIRDFANDFLSSIGDELWSDIPSQMKKTMQDIADKKLGFEITDGKLIINHSGQGTIPNIDSDQLWENILYRLRYAGNRCDLNLPEADNLDSINNPKEVVTKWFELNKLDKDSSAAQCVTRAWQTEGPALGGYEAAFLRGEADLEPFFNSVWQKIKKMIATDLFANNGCFVINPGADQEIEKCITIASESTSEDINTFSEFLAAAPEIGVIISDQELSPEKTTDESPEKVFFKTLLKKIPANYYWNQESGTRGNGQYATDLALFHITPWLPPLTHWYYLLRDGLSEEQFREKLQLEIWRRNRHNKDFTKTVGNREINADAYNNYFTKNNFGQKWIAKIAALTKKANQKLLETMTEWRKQSLNQRYQNTMLEALRDDFYDEDLYKYWNCLDQSDNDEIEFDTESSCLPFLPSDWFTFYEKDNNTNLLQQIEKLDQKLMEPKDRGGLAKHNYEAAFLVADGDPEQIFLNLEYSNPDIQARLDATREHVNNNTQYPGYEGSEQATTNSSDGDSVNLLSWVSTLLSSLKNVGEGSQTNCNGCSDDLLDSDGDWLPDIVDQDVDNDGIPDEDDPCPFNPQSNCTEKDWDGDGVPNSNVFNNPLDASDRIENRNLIWENVKRESDNSDNQDNCPLIPNPPEKDTNNDGKINSDDNQSDWDNDGLGDLCDPGSGVENNQDHEADWDADGVPNWLDQDLDGDGLINHNDPDLNGDGLRDGNDQDHDHLPDNWERRYWDILQPTEKQNTDIEIRRALGENYQNSKTVANLIDSDVLKPLTCKDLVSINKNLPPDTDPVFTPRCADTGVVAADGNWQWSCAKFTGNQPEQLWAQITGTDNDGDGRTDFQEFCEGTNPLAPDGWNMIDSLKLEVKPSFIITGNENNAAKLTATVTSSIGQIDDHQITFTILGKKAQDHASFDRKLSVIKKSVFSKNGIAKIPIYPTDLSSSVEIIASADQAVGDDEYKIYSNTVQIQSGKTITNQEITDSKPIPLYTSLLGGAFGNFSEKGQINKGEDNPEINGGYLAGWWLFAGRTQVVTATTIRANEDSPANDDGDDEADIFENKEVGFADSNQNFVMNIAAGQPIGEAGYRLANSSEILLGDPTIKLSENAMPYMRIPDNLLTGERGTWSKSGYTHDWGQMIDGGFDNKIDKLIHLDVNNDGREDFAALIKNQFIWYENSVSYPRWRWRGPLLRFDQTEINDIITGDFIYNDATTAGFDDIVIAGQDGQVYLATNHNGRFILSTIAALAPGVLDEDENLIRTKKSQIYQLGTLKKPGTPNPKLITVDTDSQITVWESNGISFTNPQKLTHTRDSKLQTSFGPIPELDFRDVGPTTINYEKVAGWFTPDKNDSKAGRYLIKDLGEITASPPQSKIAVGENEVLDPVYFGLSADTTIKSLEDKLEAEGEMALTANEQYFITMYHYFQENPSNKDTIFEFPVQDPAKPTLAKMALFQSGADANFLDDIKTALTATPDNTDSDEDGFPDAYEKEWLRTNNQTADPEKWIHNRNHSPISGLKDSSKIAEEIAAMNSWLQQAAYANLEKINLGDKKIIIAKQFKLINTNDQEPILDKMTGEAVTTWTAGSMSLPSANPGTEWSNSHALPITIQAIQKTVTQQVPVTSEKTVKNPDGTMGTIESPVLGADGLPLYQTKETTEDDFDFWVYSPFTVKRNCNKPSYSGLGGTGTCTLQITYQPNDTINSFYPDKASEITISDFIEVFYSVNIDSIQINKDTPVEIIETDNPRYPFMITGLELAKNETIEITYDYEITTVPELNVAITDLALDPTASFPDGWDCSEGSGNREFWNPETKQIETAPVYCPDNKTDITVSRGRYFPNESLYFYDGRDLSTNNYQPTELINTNNTNNIPPQGPFYSDIFLHFESLKDENGEQKWTREEILTDTDQDGLTGFQELMAGLSPDLADSNEWVISNEDPSRVNYDSSIKVNDPIQLDDLEICEGAQKENNTNDGWEDSDCDSIANTEMIAYGLPLADGNKATAGQYQLEHKGDYDPWDRLVNAATGQTNQQSFQQLEKCYPGCLATPCNAARGPRVPLLGAYYAAKSGLDDFTSCTSETATNICNPNCTEPVTHVACMATCCKATSTITTIKQLGTLMTSVYGGLADLVYGTTTASASDTNLLSSLQSHLKDFFLNMSLSTDVLITNTGNTCTGLFSTQFGPGFIFADNEVAGWTGSDSKGILDRIGACKKFNETVATTMTSVNKIAGSVATIIESATDGLISAGSTAAISKGYIDGGVTRTYRLDKNDLSLQKLNTLLQKRQDKNQKITQGAGFPAFIENWMTHTWSNIREIAVWPTLTIRWPYYPDFPTDEIRGLIEPDYESNRTQAYKEIKKMFNQQLTEINNELDSARTAGTETSDLLEEKKAWENKIKKLDAPANQDLGQLVNWLANLFMIKISELKIVVNIPQMPDSMIDFYIQQWRDWEHDICKQINTKYGPNLKCQPDQNTGEIDWKKVFTDIDWNNFGNAVNNENNKTLEKLFQEIKEIMISIQNNIKIIEQWRHFPEKILAYKNMKEKYLKDVACLLDEIINWSGGWINKQVDRIKTWIRLYHLTQMVLQDWNSLLQLFIDYDLECNECKNYRCSTGILELLIDLFGGLLPTPPTVNFPKLPNVVIDLSNIEILFDIQWPTLEVHEVPLTLPALPRINLPEINVDVDFDIELPEFARLPQPPDLPPLPQLPNLPLPGLPDIPPAPELPPLPDFIKDFVDKIGNLLDLLCFLYKNHYIPYTSPPFWADSITHQLTSMDANQCVILTERPLEPELDFDLGFSLDIPNLDLSIVDKVVAGTAINLFLKLPLFEPIKDAADQINNLVTNFVDAANQTTGNLLPEEIDLGNVEYKSEETAKPKQDGLSYSQTSNSLIENKIALQSSDWNLNKKSNPLVLQPSNHEKSVISNSDNLANNHPKSPSSNPQANIENQASDPQKIQIQNQAKQLISHWENPELPDDNEIFTETTDETTSRLVTATDAAQLRKVISEYLSGTKAHDLQPPLLRGTLVSGKNNKSNKSFIDLTLDPASDYFIQGAKSLISNPLVENKIMSETSASNLQNQKPNQFDKFRTNIENSINYPTQSIADNQKLKTGNCIIAAAPITRRTISPPSFPNPDTAENNEAAFSVKGLVATRAQEGVIEEITAFTGFTDPFPIIAFDFDQDGDEGNCISGNTCDHDIIYAYNGALYYKKFHKLGWTRQVQTDTNIFEQRLVSKCNNAVDEDIKSIHVTTPLLCEPKIDQYGRENIDTNGDGSTDLPVSRVYARQEEDSELNNYCLENNCHKSHFLKYFDDKPAIAVNNDDNPTQIDILTQTANTADTIDFVSAQPVDEQQVKLTFTRSTNEEKIAGYIVALDPTNLSGQKATHYYLLLRDPTSFAQSGNITSITNGAIITNSDNKNLAVGSNIQPGDTINLFGDPAGAVLNFGGSNWTLSQAGTYQVPLITPAGAYPVAYPDQPITFTGPYLETLTPPLSQINKENILFGGKITFPNSGISLDLTDGQLVTTAKSNINFSEPLSSVRYFEPEDWQDSDQDQLFDAWEINYFNNLDQTANNDFDSDDLDNLFEFQSHTNPQKAGNISDDQDNDGLPDWYEEADKSLSPNWNLDALLDYDHDNLNNLEEYRYMTNPHNSDSDGDNIPDKEEILSRSNPVLSNKKLVAKGDPIILTSGTKFTLKNDESIKITTTGGEKDITIKGSSENTHYTIQTFISDNNQLNAILNLPDNNSYYARVAPFGSGITQPLWSETVLLNGTDFNNPTVAARIEAPTEVLLGSTVIIDARKSSGAKKMIWKTDKWEIPDAAEEEFEAKNLGNDTDPFPNPFLVFLANETGTFTINLTVIGENNEKSTTSHTITVQPPEIEATWNNYGPSIQVVGMTAPNIPVQLCPATESKNDCANPLQSTVADNNGDFFFDLGEQKNKSPVVSSTGILSLTSDMKIDLSNFPQIIIRDLDGNEITRFVRKGDNISGVITNKMPNEQQGSGKVYVETQKEEITIENPDENPNFAIIKQGNTRIATISPDGNIDLGSSYQLGYDQDNNSDRFFYLICPSSATTCQNNSDNILARIFVDTANIDFVTTAGDSITAAPGWVKVVAIDKNGIIAVSNVLSIPELTTSEK